MKGAGRTKKMIKDDGKKQGKGKKIERKKTLVTTAKAKKQSRQDDPPHRPSKYVGVHWRKREKKWRAQITINGKNKGLGYYQDEKEAARIYDEQAALLGKPVNFPLHEGMEQAVKRAPKGSGLEFKTRYNKASKNGDDDESVDKSMEEQDNPNSSSTPIC